ncbi:MAG TPA: acetate--CoA ligase family protein, partial [Propionibacteriaceae bacterium]|nr:acetate--CoA ligase family protein [Propionibacteriaceae bacterium]
ADAAEAAGLQVVEFSATLQEEFADLAPHLGGVTNPVDLGADAPPMTIGRAVRALASSGEADALVVTLVATRTNDLPGSLTALSEAADDQPHLAIVAVVVGGDSPLRLGKGNLPVYRLPEDAVRSLGHACRYARWRREPTGCRPALAGIDRQAAQRIIAAALADGAGWQPVAVTHALLACYDIPLLETRLATSMESAAEMAGELGFPVVMKATRPGLIHKSELGAVRLGLSNESAAREAYQEIARSLDEAESQVALQRLVQTGVELVVGVAHDSLFGSLIMVGLGGVQTDLLGDRAFRSVPLTDRDAAVMWRELRAAPLLTGYRGMAAMDTDALEQLLLRVARLAEDFPEVSELDLNPVVAIPAGVAALDAKLKLEPVEDEPDAYLRSLDFRRGHRSSQ